MRTCKWTSNQGKAILWVWSCQWTTQPAQGMHYPAGSGNALPSQLRECTTQPAQGMHYPASSGYVLPSKLWVCTTQQAQGMHYPASGTAHLQTPSQLSVWSNIEEQKKIVNIEVFRTLD